MSRWVFGIARCLCTFGKRWGKQKRAEKQSMLLPSFVVFSFASYTILSQRNLQAIKCIRAQAAFARSRAECSAGAHLPAGSTTPFQCRTCRKLLLSCLAGQVNTTFGLIQQLGAVKRSNPTSRPALGWGLNTVSESMLLFVLKAGQADLRGSTRAVFWPAARWWWPEMVTSPLLRNSLIPCHLCIGCSGTEVVTVQQWGTNGVHEGRGKTRS